MDTGCSTFLQGRQFCWDSTGQVAQTAEKHLSLIRASPEKANLDDHCAWRAGLSVLLERSRLRGGALFPCHEVKEGVVIIYTCENAVQWFVCTISFSVCI